MGVDSVGRAGHQRAVVLPGENSQGLHVLRLHHQDLIHLIGQRLVQHPEQEHIPHRQLIQVAEQLGAGQAPVAADDAVGTCPAHRQGGALHMAQRHLQYSLAGAVVDGQVHAQVRDFQRRHDAGARHVQQAVVDGAGLIRHVEAVAGLREGRVVGLSGLPRCLVAGRIQLGHLLRVGHDHPGLVEGIPVVADCRIQQQGEPCHEYQHEQQIG